MSVSVDGTFDAVRAAALLSTYQRTATDVTVDFSHAEHVDEAALALLQDASRECDPCRLTMVGLNRHLERLIRYLGANPTNAGSSG